MRIKESPSGNYRTIIYTREDALQEGEGLPHTHFEKAVTGLMKIIRLPPERINRREDRLKQKKGIHSLAYKVQDDEIRYFIDENGEEKMISGGWPAIEEGARNPPLFLREMKKIYG